MPTFDAARRVVLGPGDDWPTPTPIGNGTPKPGPFPTHVLPPAVRDMVRTVAANKQVPEDLVALQGLSATAVLAGPRIAITRGRGWVEPLSLYTITAMESGTGKSPAQRDVIRALWKIQRHLQSRHRDQIAKKKATIVADMEALVAARGKADAVGKAEIEGQLKQLKMAAEELDSQPPPRLLVGDTTVEALGDEMSRNGGHMGVMDAEGGFFAVLAGRYTGGLPNLELVLKGYDADWYDVRRITRSQLFMPRAVLTLGLAVQPDVLAETEKTPAMRERGLLARFLFAQPPNLLGTRRTDPPDLDEEKMHAWARALAIIADLPTPPPDADDFPVLTLTAAARAVHVAFDAHLEPRLHPEIGDLAFMTGWASKHKGRVLRIAGLLHLLCSDIDTLVSADTMEAAVAIGEWAIPHAITVFDGWAQYAPGDDDDQCLAVLAWVRRTAAKEFGARDVQRGVRQKWTKAGGAGAVVAVLDRLVETGWLAQRETTDNAGRTALMFVPHPSLIETSAEAVTA